MAMHRVQHALESNTLALSGHTPRIIVKACVPPISNKEKQLVERMGYPNLPQIAGPYVHATKHNGTLYISGLTAYGTDAQPLDMAAQAKEVLNQSAGC